MSDADLRAWKRTEKYRMKEYEATANAIADLPALRALY